MSSSMTARIKSWFRKPNPEQDALDALAKEDKYYNGLMQAMMRYLVISGKLSHFIVDSAAADLVNTEFTGTDGIVVGIFTFGTPGVWPVDSATWTVSGPMSQTPHRQIVNHIAFACAQLAVSRGDVDMGRIAFLASLHYELGDLTNDAFTRGYDRGVQELAAAAVLATAATDSPTPVVDDLPEPQVRRETEVTEEVVEIVVTPDIVGVNTPTTRAKIWHDISELPDLIGLATEEIEAGRIGTGYFNGLCRMPTRIGEAFIGYDATGRMVIIAHRDDQTQVYFERYTPSATNPQPLVIIDQRAGNTLDNTRLAELHAFLGTCLIKSPMPTNTSGQSAGSPQADAAPAASPEVEPENPALAKAFAEANKKSASPKKKTQTDAQPRKSAKPQS